MTSTDETAVIGRPARGRVLLAVLANFFAVAAAVIASALLPRLLRLSDGPSEIVRSLVVIGVHAGLLVVALRATKLDRRQVGLSLRRADLGAAGAGAVLALVTIAGTLAIAGVVGGIHLAPAARSEWPTTTMLATSLFGTVVRSAFEEIAFRAGLVGVLGLAFRRPIAIGVPAVLFGLAHAGNHGASVIAVVNTVVAALFLGGLFLLGSAPSLAACTAFHATWNFTIGVVLGIAVSGGAGATHFFTVVVRSPTWSGGAYGIEASPATTLVYGVAAALVLLRLGRRISTEAASPRE